jgi:hypothetical protein
VNQNLTTFDAAAARLTSCVSDTTIAFGMR